MIIRSKAPLRIGLAGGGTDVSPYSDLYGGAVLNATITLYAYATIIPRDDDQIIFYLHDRHETHRFDAALRLPTDNSAGLIAAIYNRVTEDFTHRPLAFELHSFVDAPAGSGLGTSSTLVVAILGAFAEWLGLPLGEYDLAQLAYRIERKDMHMAGGKQDQYAATFGGFNFMEFYNGDRVVINPLRIRNTILNELSQNLVLFYTSTTHDSSSIIRNQQRNVADKNQRSIEAMHRLKDQAVQMKEALLKGNLNQIGEILNVGWTCKRQMAEGISTTLFEELYDTALKAGALGGKISGAGGGGFIFFYCPGTTRYHVIEALQRFCGRVQPYQFTKNGLLTWKA